MKEHTQTEEIGSAAASVFELPCSSREKAGSPIDEVALDLQTWSDFLSTGSVTYAKKNKWNSRGVASGAVRDVAESLRRKTSH